MFVMFKLFGIILIPLIIATGLTIDTTNNPNNNDNNREIEEDNSSDYSFLVIGGYRPEKHYLAKYIVSLRMGRQKRYKGDNHYCGGSIIRSRVILTAAHCVLDKNSKPIKSEITAVVGSPFLLKLTESAREYTVKYTIAHPVFSYTTMRSDVGLVILEEDIALNDDTRSIIPLQDAEPQAGMHCVALGWGRIFPGGPRPAELVYVNLTLMKRHMCQDFYPMNPTVICAQDTEDPEKGVWKGDSGSALICGGKLTGIVSFGYPQTDAPSYFSNVYEHLKWISENAGNRNNFTLYYVFFILFLVLLFYEIKSK